MLWFPITEVYYSPKRRTTTKKNVLTIFTVNSSTSTNCPIISIATSCGDITIATFAGEVRDEETGLSYFGARYSTSFRDVSWQRPQASLGALLLKRYYDADLLTGWLSVDPMADKYPSMGPYNYCASNPVKLVDPDGIFWVAWILMDSIVSSKQIIEPNVNEKIKPDKRLADGLIINRLS